MDVTSGVQFKLSKYIKSIADVIDFDMYVVDNELLRIVGTGIYSKMLGIVLPENTSNGWVIKNKEPLIMFQPLEHEICDDCPMKKSNNCGEEYSIHMPIILNDVCLGVVTIASTYDDESKLRIAAQRDKLFEFITVIADGICELIEGETKLANYKNILSFSSEAMIITDEEGNIKEMSDVIKKKFRNFKNIYDVISKNSDSYGENFNSVIFKVNDNLKINRVKVNINQDKYNQIFFIQKENSDVDGDKADNWDSYIDEELFLSQIVGKSENIEELKKVVLHSAKYNSNCLILGESGTGKEMFAKLIHKISDRRDSPFIPINCAAIPDNLIESEIFGYEGGSFTGASKNGKMGLFEAANNGTIFLDEIGDMPIYLQPKLLRVLETGKITRLGGTKEIQLDVRFIAATNKQISKQIKNGQFREDLYYRLCVIPLNLPTLRERTEDIIELTKYFMDKYNSKFSKNVKNISADVKKQLLIYDWPGNVRELENVIEYAITMERTDTLCTQSLPLNVDYKKNVVVEDVSGRSINDFKRENIKKLLEKHGKTVESKTLIAKELGVSLSTLYRYFKKYDL
jgi:transcriptional regulator with PAS, ATPase and Fis domain